MRTALIKSSTAGLAIIIVLSGATYLPIIGVDYLGDGDSFEVKAGATYYTLTVIVEGGGWTDPPHGTHTYEAGTIVSVLWWHSPGCGLDHYELNGTIVEVSRPYIITMNANYVLKAVFFEYQPLKISISPQTATIRANDSLTFSAEFVDGWLPLYRVEWYLNDSLVCVLADQGDRTLEWTFSPARAGTYQVYVTGLDSWVVSIPRDQWPRSRTATVVVNDVACTLNITSTTGGMTSPAPSEHSYSFGSEVNVCASPADGYLFDHWELDGINAGSSALLTVLMNSTYRNLRAVYVERARFTLLVVTNAGGEVVPAQGEHVYWAGTTISVSATPETGYYLDYWELDGAMIGIESSIDLVINTNHTLNAFFRQLSSGHDVAIKWVSSKTAIGEGSLTTIRASAMNVGSFGEAFDTIAYLNEIPVRTQSVILESGVAITVSLVWNTSGYSRGYYTLKVVASAVAGEYDTSNNIFTFGSILLGISGDVNSDKKIDAKDVYAIALAFGTSPSGPNPSGRKYNANCDVDDNSKVDMKDYYVVCRNYGKTYL